MKLPGLPASVPGPVGMVTGLAALPGELLERGVGMLEAAESLLGGAGRLLADVGGLLARIEETRQRADDLVARAEVTRAAADPLVVRLAALTDALEPSLTRLQPTLERLAETTDPAEVDALVGMIDHFPLLAEKLELDVVPVLHSLTSVSPDLHDLLDVSRELNEMLAKLPGMGRIKRRVDEQQELDDRG